MRAHRRPHLSPASGRPARHRIRYSVPSYVKVLLTRPALSAHVEAVRIVSQVNHANGRRLFMIIELGKVTEETENTFTPSIEVDDGSYVWIG
jgi:hypothetical protein